jgi:putative ABC transport system permease protein
MGRLAAGQVLFGARMRAMLERLRADVFSATRSLAATPIPVLAAILTLAVAVGVNLAMFGLIDRAVLSPAAHVVSPDRLFTIGIVPPSAQPGSVAMTSTSYVAFTSIRERVPTVSGASAFSRNTATVVINSEQREVQSMMISEGYFDVVGTSTLLGPGIHAGDDSASTAAPPAVIGYGFWRSALSGDGDVIGRRLTLDGLEYSVAGVMPKGFSGHSPIDTEIWVTFAGAMRNTPGWDRDDRRNFTSVLVRLADNQTVPAAATQAGAVIDRQVVLLPVTGTAIASTEKRIAWWLAGVSIVVLAIGLANAATLLVVRGARLRHDLAVRAALGASRSRLVRQGVIEAVLLAALATMASLVLASWLDDTVRRVLFPGIIERAAASARAIWGALGAGLIAAIVGAIANTRQVSTAIAVPQLSGAMAGGGRRTKTMTALILVQMTLSVTLLAGAGMFGGSLYRLVSQDFGMEMSKVLLINARTGPGDPGGDARVYLDALERLRQLPEIEKATVINTIPFTGMSVVPIAVPGRPAPPAVGRQLPFLVAATPEFFKILGIRVIEGRGLTDSDDRGTPVVIVNQTMALAVWPGESAVGKCIRIGFPPDFRPGSGPPVLGDSVPCREVVGVANDTRQRSLFPQDNEDRLMQYYVPFSQVPYPPFLPQNQPRVSGLLVRPHTMSAGLPATIRKLLVGNRTDLPFIEIRPYSQVLDRQVRPWRTGTSLLVLFSALALIVASIGLYATFAYAVAERRREMAIRLAVGARPGRVFQMVLWEAIVLAAIGGVTGCIAAVGAGRLVASLLYGTTPSDPVVLGAAALAMLIVAVLATLLPARTASRSDPSLLLRTT